MHEKRPVLAFLTDNVEGNYHESLMSGVYNAAKALDVNLVVAIGKSLNSPDSYEHNHSISYYYVNNENVDGVIISSGVMSKYTQEKQLMEFIERFSIPVVSISIPIGLSCYVDNQTGLKSVIQHLITTHKKRKIAFVRGPDDHSEAEERYNVYLETLKENHLPFNRDLIIKGYFTYSSAYAAVNVFLEKNLTFDSIVCSNDEMAFGAIRALKEHNFRVPEDIAVTGFDNISTSLLARLTTVSQPTYQLGYSAVELLVDVITEKKAESRILSTQLVIRDSCGCTLDKIIEQKAFSVNSVKTESFIEDFTRLVADEINTMFDLDEFKALLHTLLDNLQNSKNKALLFSLFNEFVVKLNEDNCFLMFNIFTKLCNALSLLNINPKESTGCFFDLTTILIEQLNQKRSARKRQVLDSVQSLRRILIKMLSTTPNFDQQKKYLFEKINELGIKNFSIYLYETNFYFDKGDIQDYIKPQNLKLFLSTQSDSYTKQAEHRLITGLFSAKRNTYVILPLFFQDEHLGLALYEYQNLLHDNSIFETLSVELSCALKISQLLQYRDKIEHKLQVALKELENYNQELNYLSTSDELTGLYNRRGFFNLASETLERAEKTHSGGFLFYIDMDGLKAINDTYGHEEGDRAILTIANILKKAFRSSDIIARLGGDEFTVLSVSSYPGYEKLLKERIESLLDELNSASGKPYTLSVSIGYIAFREEEKALSIDTLMRKADRLLYTEKNKKKTTYN